MHFLGTKEGAQPMGGISASDTSSSHHTYEAVKDEARLIQDSLLPVGTLRGPSFEVAYRYQPLAEVGGDVADFFHLPNGLVGLYVGDVVSRASRRRYMLRW
jgi:serine phosphatase RsbU (regulator of sigma subunit)